jgi:hypothetical protein
MRFVSCLVPAVLLPVALGATACASQAAVRTHAFVCDEGKSFQVRYAGGRALVTTQAGRWSLPSRPSSIGRKFASGDATFIHDEDRAALNGLPGGPFRRCREGVEPVERRKGGAALL